MQNMERFHAHDCYQSVTEHKTSGHSISTDETGDKSGQHIPKQSNKAGQGMEDSNYSEPVAISSVQPAPAHQTMSSYKLLIMLVLQWEQ